MKATTQLALGAAGSLLLGSAALGDIGSEFWRVEVRELTSFFHNDHPNQQVRDAYADAGLRTFRVYATFFAPTQVYAHGGHSGLGATANLNAFAGALWNFTQEDHYTGDELHYNLAPTSSQIGANPSHAFDTFITIGTHVNPTDLALYTISGGPGFAAETNNMQNSWTVTDSGIFLQNQQSNLAVATQNQQGLANDGYYRVMLYQYSIDASASPLVFGDIGLLTGRTSTGTLYDLTIGGDFKWIPSPGGVAILLMAGLFGSRRRE